MTSQSDNGWMSIDTFDEPDLTEVDLWLEIHASPRSMGFADSFRVPDAFRRGGKWFHRNPVKEEELYAPYITHWRHAPNPPRQP